MKNSKAVIRDFIEQITLPENQEEIESVAYLVFGHLFQLSRTAIMIGAPMLADDYEVKLKAVADRINAHEPVQYILGEADFFGRNFKVTPAVLIPRPETEELVREALEFISEKHSSCKVLDIGTGSGCIPITLKLERSSADVMAIDISEDALYVARQNGRHLHADVKWIRHDILSEEFPLENLDLVVSNPPYIRHAEKETMSNNVLDYEPHLALFVDHDDPLLFYRSIAKHAFQHLRAQGALMVEINEQFGVEVAELFTRTGFHKVQIIKDLSGKDRIVKAVKEK